MKLLKPTWVHHDEKPIFSVDVHQECLKFATGGQGMDSGRVVVWNLLPVLSEKAELDDSVPKMLCQMDNHLACVNSVRWSQNGQMLASGSDDKLVMIWRLSKVPSGVFGTGGVQKKNPESWKCTSTLRGHSGDVLDLAWSPHDRWLASCSVDNTIIVWDVHSLPAMVAVLKGHTGLVKGVAWDPVGKFLASQSDDRSVKIWKTSDWHCSSTITEPFEECGGTTHILRLSWSPDGQYLVSAHAMNGGGPTAQIIEREGWKCDKDFVGHRKAVTCVRFHNSILKRLAPQTQRPQQYCCLAVGSRDRSLSVWMTALQRPLIVIHDLFNDSILDLSWGPAMCILMACSGDGTVACLQFADTELGQPLSEEERNSLYQRIYGKSVMLSNGSNDGATADMLIENAELLEQLTKPPTLPNHHSQNSSSNHCLLQSSAGTLPVAPTIANGFAFDSATANSDGYCNSAATASSAAPTKAISRQLETRTADGKRRITPVFIPINQEMSEPAVSLSSSSRAIETLAATAATTDSGIADGTAAAASTVVHAGPTTVMSSAKISEAEQLRLDTRLTKCTAVGAASTLLPLLQPQPASNTTAQAFPVASSGTSNHNTSTLAGASGSGSSNNNNSNNNGRMPPTTVYQASTAGPKLTITNTTRCEFQKTALELRVHVHNGCAATATALLCKVTAYALCGNEKLWTIFVGSPVVNLNFCTKYAMLCSLDGSMRLLDMRTGSAMWPVLTLGSAALQCAFCPLGRLMGVITECGTLRIWNIVDMDVTVATSCTEVFGKYGPILQFNISENGVPLLLFANGNSYTYSGQLQSWLVLNTKDPLLRHGLQATVPKDFQKNYRTYPLTSLQASTHGITAATAAASGNAIELNANDWQAGAKIAFIENQIKLCEAINSPDELRHWYTMLAYHLAISGAEKQLRLLLDDLLGAQDFGTTTHKILSISKHALMADVLMVLKSHVKWQRIYMEYFELFDSVRSINATATAAALTPLTPSQTSSLGAMMDTDAA